MVNVFGRSAPVFSLLSLTSFESHAMTHPKPPTILVFDKAHLSDEDSTKNQTRLSGGW